MKIKLEKLLPKMMPVTKSNKVFKSKKDYNRKKKHKKELDSEY